MTHLIEKKSELGLHLQGVSYLYPTVEGFDVRGLHPVNMRLMSGQAYGLVGHNGAGKSTLFKLISGALYPQVGHIYLYGQRVTKMPMWRRARLGLGYLGQSSMLVEDMTVKWNLDLGRESYQKWRANRVSYDHQTQFWSLDEIIDLMEVTHHLKQRVDTLSGGEKRRVEMARILLNRPRVLILDEPFAALDQEGLTATIHLIEYICGSGALVLLTDHQNKYVDNICQHTFHLRKGKLEST